MHVSRSEQIAGYPSIKIRNFLKKVKERTFTISSVARYFTLTPRVAINLIRELHNLGYVTARDEAKDSSLYWEVSNNGRTLALASASKQLLRKTAEKKISELIARVNIVNNSPDYLYEVSKVIVFGSYLSTKEKISDIDIAIDFNMKSFDEKKFDLLRERSILQAEKEGRVFSSFLARVSWPLEQVRLFLKSRSTAFSFHSMSDGVLEKANQKVIFEKEKAQRQT